MYCDWTTDKGGKSKQDSCGLISSKDNDKDNNESFKTLSSYEHEIIEDDLKDLKADKKNWYSIKNLKKNNSVYN